MTTSTTFKARKLLSTDGYKLSHFEQYPKTVTSIYGNLTARSDKHFKHRISSSDNKYVVFGIYQAMKEIKAIFQEEFFSVPFEEAITAIKRTISNYTNWKEGFVNALKRIHDLGYLPLHVRSVKEGTSIDINMPCATIVSDDTLLFSFLEPMITSMTWKSITNATSVREYYLTGKRWMEKTSGDKNSMLFQFHDFSSRGMSGVEDAARSGTPHLIAFRGTESVSALTYIEDMYNWDYEKEGMLAGTIEATEHSVASSNIMYEQATRGCDLEEAEYHYLKRYITEVYPTGYVAFVADTFDFYRTVYNILPRLKEEVLARDGKLVIRPDSFEPIYGLCGINLPRIEEGTDVNWEDVLAEDDVYRFRNDTDIVTVQCNADGILDITSQEMTPEELGTIQILWNTFGGNVNELGYRELDSHIGVIYGDGISNSIADEIFRQLAKNGFASTTLVIGIGAGTYQWNSRDTLGIAYKATQITTSDVGEIDIYKDPVGGFKTSAKGLLAVNKVEGKWVLTEQATKQQELDSEMETVFKDGVLVDISFSEIRNNFTIDNK